MVVEIARGAGELTLDWFGGRHIEVETKQDGTPVTVADRAAERYVREQVDKLAPGSSLIGEEEGKSSGSGPLTWYVDPIDGTKGFARGVPLYATLIGVHDEHGPAVGVIYIPATREMVWAGRGRGAWTPEGRAVVSTTSSLDGSFITTSSVSRWGPEVFGRAWAARVDVRGWGDGYGFLMAATGRVDAMVDLRGGNVWDFAPLPVIFDEAGGCVSAPDGTPSIHTSSIVASNGLLHEAVLRLVNGNQ